MDDQKYKIKTFSDLNAWKEGHRLVLQTYKATESFPKAEVFGLSSQLRRSAVSITSNIAEGFGRISYKEKLRFNSMAQGSVAELQNQMLIARDVGYLSDQLFDSINAQSVVVHKLITGLIRSCREHSAIKNDADPKP